jgi:hypothetical protein
MIWAVAEPVFCGQPVRGCDILVWEQTSPAPSRCHEGLLQLFIKGRVHPDGRWVSFGRLLASASNWDEMKIGLRSHDLNGKRVVLVPAGGPL